MRIQRNATSAARAAELRRRIDDANRRYHQLDAPDITDAQYDALVRELEALEAAHPELAAADSPTARVGAAPAGRFPPVVHALPMLSLGNAFSDEEVADFVRRIGERESGEAVFHEQGGRGGDRCAAFALDLQHARHLNGRARRCA